MGNIKYIRTSDGIPGESKPTYDVQIKVDIQLGDTVYKDAVITVPESTLRSIVWQYETSHNW